MIYRLEPPEQAAALFAGWEETIIWSCLSGAMGEICADAPGAPGSAMAALGDFCFFAGRPCRELLRFAVEEPHRGRRILVPRDPAWAALMEEGWGKILRRAVRTAIKKEPGVFDRARLEEAAASLPQGHRLAALDEGWFHRCRESEWSRDFTTQYRDWGHFRQYGLGVLVLRGEELVAGASSYSGWPGGIEVEIDTRADCRRRGLAHAAGAALILACLDRDWYPSWDAQNPASAALAEKLGYHRSHEYPVYERSAD